MTKFAVFVLIFFLIISTLIIKNSTKEIEDEIYNVKENLLFLENRLKDSKLEFDYLSSSEKLLEFQKLYFENSLQKKSLQEIKTLKTYNSEIKIGNLTILGKNYE
jgi:DNA replication protein DnaC|tara:strand:- start:11982 stop:12296 length:315 start_codon:yes stop_codon:yes gene_type:complete